MADLRDALDRLAARPVGIVTSETLVSRSRRRKRRRRSIAAGAVGAVLMAVVLGAFAIRPHSDESRVSTGPGPATSSPDVTPGSTAGASSGPVTTDCAPFRALVTEADAGGDVDVGGVGARFSLCLDEAKHPLRQLVTAGCAVGSVSNLSVRGPDSYPIGFEVTGPGSCTIVDGDYHVRIVVSG
jgi:hypothetical protein